MTPSGTRNSGAVHFIANLAKFNDLLCRKGASLGDLVKLERKGKSPSSIGQKLTPSPFRGINFYLFKREKIFAQERQSDACGERTKRIFDN